MSGDWRRGVRRFFTASFLASIRLYQIGLGPLFAGACRFHPSCSRYTEEAIRRHGPARGTLLGAQRLLRCRPFGGSGHDPVPEEPRRPPADQIARRASSDPPRRNRRGAPAALSTGR